MIYTEEEEHIPIITNTVKNDKVRTTTNKTEDAVKKLEDRVRWVRQRTDKAKRKLCSIRIYKFF